MNTTKCTTNVCICTFLFLNLMSCRVQYNTANNNKNNYSGPASRLCSGTGYRTSSSSQAILALAWQRGVKSSCMPDPTLARINWNIQAGFIHGLEEVNTDVRFSVKYFPPPCQKNSSIGFRKGENAGRKMFENLGLLLNQSQTRTSFSFSSSPYSSSSSTTSYSSSSSSFISSSTPYSSGVLNLFLHASLDPLFQTWMSWLWPF